MHICIWHSVSSISTKFCQWNKRGIFWIGIWHRYTKRYADSSDFSKIHDQADRVCKENVWKADMPPGMQPVVQQRLLRPSISAWLRMPNTISFYYLYIDITDSLKLGGPRILIDVTLSSVSKFDPRHWWNIEITRLRQMFRQLCNTVAFNIARQIQN